MTTSETFSVNLSRERAFQQLLNYFETRKYVVTKQAPLSHMEVNSKYCFLKIDVIPRNGKSQVNLDFDINTSVRLLPKSLRLIFFYKEKSEIIKEIIQLFSPSTPHLKEKNENK